jgi:hypothetical protein
MTGFSPERLFVWLGGALFVVSLSFTTWWYAVPLGRPEPRAGWAPIMADALIFSAFALHHSLFARARVKAWLGHACPAHLLRSLYVWIASALLILVLVLWQRVGGAVYDLSGWRALAPTAVQATGAWLTVQSVRAIDPLELAGIRPGRGSAGLQTTGPYQVVRHPLYLGWMLMVFGAAHLTGDRVAFAAMSSFYLIVAIPWEERSLEQSFGEPYARYKKQVRWRVVPYVY